MGAVNPLEVTTLPEKPTTPTCVECGRELKAAGSRMTYRGEWICRYPSRCAGQRPPIVAMNEWVKAQAAPEALLGEN